MNLKKSNLNFLENQSIYILREVAAEAKNPVLLYSIGKDSSVLLHLAAKAFYPEKIPFRILHVDTGWKFTEMYKYREKVTKKYNLDLLIYKNKKGEKNNVTPLSHSSEIYTDIMKTQALKEALDKHNFDLAIGGARRDEEKSRAKERIFSIRNNKHSWDPKYQRPECWENYNLNLKTNQKMRVFPLSNWTELDIWSYIFKEKINLVSLYFAKKRPFIIRNQKIIMVDDNRLKLHKEEKIINDFIRFRTLGCYPLTAGILSNANTMEKIIKEIFNSNNSEREGRLIDKDEASSMEIKKLQGYF